MVDLHLHSTASDGAFPPAGVVSRASRAGLTAIALTDHDSISGIPEAYAAGTPAGVRIISGCEFSVRGPGGELHLLGYFLPLDVPELNTFLERCRRLRVDRAREMVTRLRSAGLAITLEQIQAVAGRGAIGRPHVARALLAAGLVRSVNHAFDRYIGWQRPAFVPKELPEFAAVASLVHRIGGIVSAAHLKARGTREILQQLLDEGLDAVEIRHPSHDHDARARLSSLADELGLLKTGGSDWHGDEGLTGTHGALGGQEVPAAWLDAMAARVAGGVTRPAPTGGLSSGEPRDG
ncbi:MAG: PHP domain-containing protein [Gemmatimonadales bacterium]